MLAGFWFRLNPSHWQYSLGCQLFYTEKPPLVWLAKRNHTRASVCLSVHPLVCLSIHLPVYPSVCLPVHPYVCLSIHQSICTSVSPYVHPSIYPYIHLSVHHPSIHIHSVCMSICPSFHLPAHRFSWLYIHLSAHSSVYIHLSTHPSVHQSICLCIHLSAHPSVHQFIFVSPFKLPFETGKVFFTDMWLFVTAKFWLPFCLCMCTILINRTQFCMIKNGEL